jgi:4-hydroxybenzoate polyprenyltransferase
MPRHSGSALSLFLREVIAVFTNDYFDFESDRRNKNFGPFTGGSRVLVEGRISPARMRSGIAWALSGFAAAFLALAALVPPPGLIALGLIAVLAIGYTTPPLKLCWRGLGELDVALTHSTVIIRVPDSADRLPAFVLRLFLGRRPSSCREPGLRGGPAAGKRSLAVVVGPRAAIRIAQALTVLATVTALAWEGRGVAASSFDGIGIFAVPHALLLAWLLERHLKSARPAARIDGLMALALLYIVWFVAVPLYHLV